MSCIGNPPYRPSPCPLPRRERERMWLSLLQSPLLPLEVWLPLFVEGADALEAIVGDHRDVVGLDGERHARLEVSLTAPVDGLLRLAHRHRAIGGDGGCDLEGLRARLARGHEVIHEAESLRFRGRHTAS